jgi:hypothetical protein
VLMVVCAMEIALFVYARTASGLAHVHAIQAVAEPGPGSAAAACVEAESAIGDFGPVLSLLNVGRLAPSAAVRAWGQVPRLADAVSQGCPSLAVYAGVAPWPDFSIEQGAAADLLSSVRAERQQLAQANAQLAQAWTTVQSVDVDALNADSRLQRAARLVAAARAQHADIADTLAVAAPDRLEALLGGNGPRAVVLELADAGADGLAYAVLHEGRVTTVANGQPPVPTAATVTVNRAGLHTLRASVHKLTLPDGAPDGEVLRAIVQQMVRLPLSDDVPALSALRHSADSGDAWLRFDDPALQGLAARRGWVRQ